MSASSLPLVSIITPSYNQAAFIKQTIDSILMQDYPNIEHIVVDGASTDRTVAILKSYEYLGDRFRYVSEPDRGQAHAINKGLKMARGEIIGWLNSDDTYFPGAVRKAVTALLAHPEWGMVYGKGMHIDEYNRVKYPYIWMEFDRRKLFHLNLICQPTAFLRKHVFESVGGVDEEHDWCMDYDLWNRISLHYQIGWVEEYLANSRLYPACKTIANEVEPGFAEILRTVVKHFGTISNEWLGYYVTKHYSQGINWFLSKIKKYHAFGRGPVLLTSNRYPDLWAPQQLRLSVEIPPTAPMRGLLLHGRSTLLDQPLHFHVLVNGTLAHHFQITQPSFNIVIPIIARGPNCEVSIICNRQTVSQQPDGSLRSVSYHALGIHPLSYEEHQFVLAFLKGPTHISEWVNNRKPVPRY
ncbi:glycosyltransferase family 2 protein [Brevibacillus sp. GCM10020057]|uniref:glycosyltransferase family 2 protein n=1 Tax=Brevibacillus sp. GCM10020057 TaxID=3317327 RepID=UPI0036312809